VTVRPGTGLGRGLAALIPQRAPSGGGTIDIPLDRIRDNPRQPRLRMADDALETLAASIRQHGVIQPILVTETIDGYRLVAGERRVRAARMAGLERVPAVVRQLADREQLELALVENLQREDLDPIEAARAYRQLIDEFAFTQEELASRVGRARSTVANTLRLLDLHPAVQAAVAAGRVTEGHARAIGGLPVEAQARLLEPVVERDLSVRQTEELVRRIREPKSRRSPGAASTAGPPRDADLERVEEDLRRALGTKVSLARSRRGGRIVIEYYSDEELTRLYDRLIGRQA
jgi:ParB family chromosome partitioning protein